MFHSDAYASRISTEITQDIDRYVLSDYFISCELFYFSINALNFSNSKVRIVRQPVNLFLRQTLSPLIDSLQLPRAFNLVSITGLEVKSGIFIHAQG